MARRCVVLLIAWMATALPGWSLAPRDQYQKWIEDLIERPVSLTAGAGQVHQPVTTSDPEAQAFYDQGLAWLHAYFWIEAARSFRQALRQDPNLALAHVGLSVALWNLELWNRAGQELNRAEALAEGLSEREQMLIQARRLQWEAIVGPSGERFQKHQAYRNALEAILARYPDDAEVWVLRGMAEEAAPWGRGQLGGIRSVAYYQAALAADPNHSGAQHYLAHAFENLGQYALARRYAEAFARSASRAPHALHMAGHIDPRLGRWEEALEHFAQADRLERDYYAAEKIPSWVDWHHLHNLHLYGLLLLRQGKTRRAGQVLEEAFHTPAISVYPEVFSHVPYLEYLLHTGQFAATQEAAKRMGTESGLVGQVVGEIFTAEALLLRGNREAAQRLIDRFADRIQQLQEQLTGNNAGLILSKTRSLADQVQAEAQLLDPDPTAQWLGAQSLLGVANALTRAVGFDGWGEGLLRLERMLRVAVRSGNEELAQELRERIARLDPDYRPTEEFPAP